MCSQQTRALGLLRHMAGFHKRSFSVFEAIFGFSPGFHRLRHQSGCSRAAAADEVEFTVLPRMRSGLMDAQWMVRWMHAQLMEGWMHAQKVHAEAKSHWLHLFGFSPLCLPAQSVSLDFELKGT